MEWTYSGTLQRGKVLQLKEAKQCKLFSYQPFWNVINIIIFEIITDTYRCCLESEQLRNQHSTMT